MHIKVAYSGSRINLDGKQHLEDEHEWIQTEGGNLQFSAANGLYVYTYSTHMVLEAKLVSSSFSFPSRAMPSFTRLFDSKGRTVIVFETMQLGCTFSLECTLQGIKQNTSLILEQKNSWPKFNLPTSVGSRWGGTKHETTDEEGREGDIPLSRKMQT